MMLPNMTPEGFSQLASKGFQAVPQLCQAASENAANLRSTLTAVLGSSRESSEVMQVGLLTIPCACCFAVHLCLLLLCVMHFKRNVLNVEMQLEVPATYVWFVHHLMDIIGKDLSSCFDTNLCDASASSLFVPASAKLRSAGASMCAHKLKYLQGQYPAAPILVQDSLCVRQFYMQTAHCD